MTAHIVVVGETGVTIVSESLGQQIDLAGRATGHLMNVSKCALLPMAPALLAGRGVTDVLHHLASACQSESFDGLIELLPNALRTTIDRFTTLIPTKRSRFDETEILLGGFSESLQKFEAYFLIAHGKYPGGVRPFEMHGIQAPLFALPWSDPAMEKLNEACPHARDFDPTIHSALYFDSIADEMASMNEPIGGRIQVSTVERDGVSARWIDREWPASVK